MSDPSNEKETSASTVMTTPGPETDPSEKASEEKEVDMESMLGTESTPKSFPAGIKVATAQLKPKKRKLRVFWNGRPEEKSVLPPWDEDEVVQEIQDLNGLLEKYSEKPKSAKPSEPTKKRRMKTKPNFAVNFVSHGMRPLRLLGALRALSEDNNELRIVIGLTQIDASALINAFSRTVVLRRLYIKSAEIIDPRGNSYRTVSPPDRKSKVRKRNSGSYEVTSVAVDTMRGTPDGENGYVMQLTVRSSRV